MPRQKQDLAKIMVEKLAKLGNVHLIQRYNEEGKAFGVKAGFEDSANLVANADLVVSYGGTIAREAALQGCSQHMQSLNMAKTYVNKYLARRVFHCSSQPSREYLGTPRSIWAKDLT